jgi:hypothetical protein
MSARSFLLTVLAAALPALAQGQSPHVQQVVRWENGHGLTVLFTRDLTEPGIAADLREWQLVDRDGGVIPLSAASTLDCTQCTFSPDSPVPGNRICVPLAGGAPPLRGEGRYVLFTDTVKLDGATMPPSTLELAPVRGSVQPIEQRTRFVGADYPVDLSRNPSVEPRVSVNRRPVRIVTPRDPGMPLCYRRGGLDFLCEVDRLITGGDTVEVDLVSADGTPFDTTLAPTVAKVAPPEKQEESRVYLGLVYSRLQGDGNGTLTLNLHDLWAVSVGRLMGPAEATISPYADLLVTSKTDGSGRYTLGPQVQAYLYELPLLHLVDLRLIPRWEADDGNQVGHLMYGDVQARLYMPGFYAQELPQEGNFRIIPRVGVQAGSTVRGADSIGREADDPRRIVAGAEAVFSWPAGKLPLAPAGARIVGDAVMHFIRRDRAFTSPSSGQPLYWTVSGTWKMAPNFGFTLTRRSGRLPPLFKHQSALEFGVAFLL